MAEVLNEKPDTDLLAVDVNEMYGSKGWQSSPASLAASLAASPDEKTSAA